jgi:hypothetical protein
MLIAISYFSLLFILNLLVLDPHFNTFLMNGESTV